MLLGQKVKCAFPVEMKENLVEIHKWTVSEGARCHRVKRTQALLCALGKANAVGIGLR